MPGSTSGLFEFNIDRCDCLLTSGVQEAVDEGQTCVFGQDMLGVSGLCYRVARLAVRHMHRGGTDDGHAGRPAFHGMSVGCAIRENWRSEIGRLKPSWSEGGG